MPQNDEVSHVIFEIGDWSSDGHSISAQFLVKVNKSLEDLREIHFKENDLFGDLVADYHESSVEVAWLIEVASQYLSEEAAHKAILQFIAEADIPCERFNAKNPLHSLKVTTEELASLTLAKLEEKSVAMNLDSAPEAVLALWLAILRLIDPSLTTEVLTPAMSYAYIKYKGYPVKPDDTIHFYGFDEKNRHLNTPGYGVMGNYSEEFRHGW